MTERKYFISRSHFLKEQNIFCSTAQNTLLIYRFETPPMLPLSDFIPFRVVHIFEHPIKSLSGYHFACQVTLCFLPREKVHNVMVEIRQKNLVLGFFKFCSVLFLVSVHVIQVMLASCSYFYDSHIQSRIYIFLHHCR